jgi:hypothetical protein
MLYYPYFQRLIDRLLKAVKAQRSQDKGHRYHCLLASTPRNILSAHEGKIADGHIVFPCRKIKRV